MKPVGRILLVTLYCVVTVGMTISTHYCGPVPVASHLGSSTAEPEWCCGDIEIKVNCCTTVSVTLIVSDVHAASTHEISSPKSAAVILPVQNSHSTEHGITHLHQPTVFLPGTSHPLTILHSSFLI